METIQYKYNKSQILFTLIVLPITIFVFYMLFFEKFGENKPWLLFGGLALIILLRFIYIVNMYLIPLMKGKIALELDEDKLQLFITGQLLLVVPRDVAYWKDIEEINYLSPSRGSPTIIFKMKDKSTFGFKTKFIAGDESDIYGIVMKYYNNSTKNSASTGE